MQIVRATVENCELIVERRWTAGEWLLIVADKAARKLAIDLLDGA